ncbi:MAG: hypothetical protein KAG98_00220 [Lentisphaeria bacterium]|nr:hypothetical protein [Lentisphaeria bacterium]
MKISRLMLLFLLTLLCTGCMKFYQTKIEEPDKQVEFLAHRNLKIEDFEYEYISESDHDSGLGFSGGIIPIVSTKFGNHSCYKSQRMNKYVTDLLESYKVNTRSADCEFIIEGLIPIREYNRSPKYYLLDVPLIVLTLQSYYVQHGHAEVEIRIYRKNREFVKSYHAKKKTVYSTIGVPFHTWGAFEYTCFPVALEMATKDCINRCLNQFFEDYRTGVLK